MWNSAFNLESDFRFPPQMASNLTRRRVYNPLERRVNNRKTNSGWFSSFLGETRRSADVARTTRRLLSFPTRPVTDPACKCSQTRWWCPRGTAGTPQAAACAAMSAQEPSSWGSGIWWASVCVPLHPCRHSAASGEAWPRWRNSGWILHSNRRMKYYFRVFWSFLWVCKPVAISN